MIETPPHGAYLPRDDEVVIRDHLVTAVLVAHDGARWLPAALSTLAELERLPDVLVGVDTGSRDGSGDLLREALGEEYVVTAGPDEGFGAAVERGLERAVALAPATTPADDGIVRWVWLLHDDCAVLPDTLQVLLEISDELPSVEVLGPKVRGWHDRRLLVEAGLTVSGSGRRETGLERGETDQGQHDQIRDVLAVSSAGMLVRRELWDRLEGFDPALPLFRDDIEFCWRAREAGARVVVAPDSVIHHAEAASRGRRRLSAVMDRPHLIDRAHALYTAFVHAPAWRLLFTTARHIVGTLLRVIGFLLAKAPTDARDDVVALALVLARPDRVLAGRRRSRRTRAIPPREVRRFMLPPGHALRHGVEWLAGVLTTSRAEEGIGALESGPVGEDAEFLAPTGVRRVARRPAIVLTVGLLAVCLLAARNRLGLGVPSGGALLPTPDSGGALWHSYLAGWHDVGPGSTLPAAPYLVVLWVLSAPFLGHAAWLVAALLLLAPALAGLSAYLATRGVVPSRWVRVWAAATYALLPATVGAVTSGRLGTLVLAVLLPLLARTAFRALVGPSGRGSWRATWAAALLVAVIAAFVPGLLVLTPVVALLVGLFLARTRLMWSRLVALALTPVLLLAPWSFWVLAHPTELLLEAGLSQGVGLSDRHLQSWDVALLHPGGAGTTPVWTTLGLLLAALLAGFRADTRRAVLVAWLVAVPALGAGLLQSRLRVTPPTLRTPLVAWPGPATLLLGAAFVLVAVFVASGWRTRMRRASFGLSQPVSVVVLVLLLAAPAVAAGYWVARAPSLVHASTASAVPAFVSAQSGPPDQPRSLLLGPVVAGRVAYTLVPGSGAQLGDAEVAPPAWTTAALDSAVSGMVAGRAGGDARTLTTYGIRFVLTPGSGDTVLAARLDSEPGLRRVAASDGSAVWLLNPSPPRAFVMGLDGRTLPLSWTDGAVSGAVPSGKAGRLLVLSTPSDTGWWARLDGVALHPVTLDGWGQAFELPATPGQVTAGFDSGRRHTLLWLQGLALLVVVTLALPGRRREPVDVDEDELGGDEPRHVLPDPHRQRAGGPEPAAEPAAEPEVEA